MNDPAIKTIMPFLDEWMNEERLATISSILAREQQETSEIG